ncbi:MAG TPA: hypothetical protein VHM90_07360 [Phycisphaerae bacterium]|nr:hypothetical protein [Phycisphaerae bacterium]
MNCYDIRLRKENGAVMIYNTAKANEFEAIRAANALADDCSMVEVWNGMRCIYSSEQNKYRGYPSAAVRLGRS